MPSGAGRDREGDPERDIAGFFSTDSERALTQRETLEDFFLLGNSTPAAALLSKRALTQFQTSVLASVISSNLNISLAYAQKRYASEGLSGSDPREYLVFQEAYFTAMDHLRETASRFSRRVDQVEPYAGEVYSDAALHRAESSFYAAGLLFRIGNLFEAQAIARIILEQVAWSYAVGSSQSLAAAIKIEPSKAVSALRKILPASGRLYGELSRAAHIGVTSHTDFLDFSGKSTRVLLTHGRKSWVKGRVLLELADYWSVVYEFTQHRFMKNLENWKVVRSDLVLEQNRPFLTTVARLR